MIDGTDREILDQLLNNARTSLRDIGKAVGLSAPAVGDRIHRLERDGLIVRYAAVIDHNLISPRSVAFINVIMKEAGSHSHFLAFVEESSMIREVHRLSGDSCYLLRVETKDEKELESLLDAILRFGNYRLNIAVSSNVKSPALRTSAAHSP